MKELIYFLISIAIPATSISQTSNNNIVREQVPTDICERSIVFEKCESPANFKYGKKAMEDSLTMYLQAAKSTLQSGKAVFILIVAKDEKVYQAKLKSGNLTNEEDIIEALYKTDGLWDAGKQNSRKVCSFVTMEIETKNNSVKVKLLKS